MAEHTWRALEQIERAQRQTPFCACGRPTRVIERDGGLWLECPILEPASGRLLARVASLLGPVEHVRTPIVDALPAAA